MISKSDFQHLSETFSGPEGRYNYFPRITGWKNNLDLKTWFESLEKYQGNEIDLYIHIPFCERFCHFCGCNIKVAAKNDIIENYLSKLANEWALYERYNFKIKSLYFGGGTPNSLTSTQLERLLDTLPGNYSIHSEYDPRYKNFDFINTLMSRGLKSISMGIQDFDETVLASIGRRTDFLTVEENLKYFKSLNLEKISIDLIYGLPRQGESSLTKLEEFLKLDLISNISLYPFAEVPWFKDFYPAWSNEKFSIAQKNELQFNFIEKLSEYGFAPISFGHFTNDKNQLMKQERTIMGFNKECEDIVIALGVSAISSTPENIKQNTKIFDHYMIDIQGQITGHIRSNKEARLQELLLNLSANKEVSSDNFQIPRALFELDLLKSNDATVSLSENGRYFCQYICGAIVNENN
ncbi:radical SAM protein [Bacteriovorax sp. Seq25_V]|uniref:radical SAM protein n=1 Tax=Bacteriovorax sp. Seq25_V TaxID=1201288 RepID=UPI00038A0EB6|nr:radical SAM protein [Bacteriovorax sp. Seq25_V]EQC46110.1 radical SAM domain protein [Bacteriovorax sp. Seq25_V]